MTTTYITPDGTTITGLFRLPPMRATCEWRSGRVAACSQPATVDVSVDVSAAVSIWHARCAEHLGRAVERDGRGRVRFIQFNLGDIIREGSV